jgi:4-hydroxy-tetrahydrodipicolinate reductase
MIRVGLLGFGKAGQAVANVLLADPRYALVWVGRHSEVAPGTTVADSAVPVLSVREPAAFDALFERLPIDALIDFSAPDSVLAYGEAVRKTKITLVSAISAYTPEQLVYIRSLGADTRVMSSPNITIGINFLIFAARLLRHIAPLADVEIIEHHFKNKSEVSGTARKIADSLGVDQDRITALRLGGIVGHHEVIFGFPFQTVRLTHDSIKREAFGTGAAFAVAELVQLPPGFYSFEDILTQKMQAQLANGVQQQEGMS